MESSSSRAESPFECTVNRHATPYQRPVSQLRPWLTEGPHITTCKTNHHHSWAVWCPRLFILPLQANGYKWSNSSFFKSHPTVVYKSAIANASDYYWPIRVLYLWKVVDVAAANIGQYRLFLKLLEVTTWWSAYFDAKCDLKPVRTGK